MFTMSWHNNNRPPMQQPGLVPAYPPPIAGVPSLPATSVPDYGALNADQYKQWQWQQYHMQYAQWHAQYGEQYARETGKAMPPAATPLLQMQPVPSLPMSSYAAAPFPTAGASFASLNLVAPPPPAEPHPDELSSSKGQEKPPPPEEKSAEEIAFDEQFRKWEQEFESWKRKNKNHPDKQAYRDYEQKCMDCRKKLLERREQLRRKRIEQMADAQTLTRANIKQSSQSFCPPQPPEPVLPPPPSGPPNEAEVEGFRSNESRAPDVNGEQNFPLQNVFQQSTVNGEAVGGIPGLDLIDENSPPVPKKIKLEEDVVEVIDLVSKEEDVKPPISEVSNTVNAISSLLNDPKVNALLQLVGSTIANSTANNGAGSGTNAEGTNPLVAALAQLTSSSSSRTGNLDVETAKHNIDSRLNGSVRRSEDNHAASPSAAGPSAMDKDNSGGRHLKGFDPRIPPPLLEVDLSRPPPLIHSNKRQQNDRWNGRMIDQHMGNGTPSAAYSGEGSPRAKVPRFDRPPPPFQTRRTDYHMDPELGRPVAVPKPDWMTEDEYQEIYDRYEHIQGFEERKNKMELAIHILRQSKIREGKPVSGEASLRASMPEPLPSVKSEVRSDAGDEFFQPQQVFDYTNYRNPPISSVNLDAPAGRVIDYGHCASGQYGSNNIGNGGNNRRENYRNNVKTAIGHEFGSNTQRFDYNHSRVSSIAPPAAAVQQQNKHWPLENQAPAYDRTVPGLERLAQMHLNPNPEESNPNYPSKFLLINDNRPNCLSTKRGKRPSSIRKQKLKQQQREATEQQQLQGPDSRTTAPASGASACKQEPALDLEDLSSDEDTVEERVDGENSTDDGVGQLKQAQREEREESVVSSQSSQNLSAPRTIDIEDLLLPPGRLTRPPRICLLVRGLPGSGKSFLARLIKNKEQSFGTSPRVLSIDDYFLVDHEEEEKDPATGKVAKATRSRYEFDGEMEEVYIQHLLKAFKRTISERLFNFVIVDCCNHRLEYYCEFHNYARSNGFKVYTCTMQTDVSECARQNIHNRTEEEIKAYADSWAMAPDEHVQINFSGLLQSDQQDTDNTVTEMELAAIDEERPGSGEDTLPQEDLQPTTSQDDDNGDSADSSAKCDLFASKWDNDASEQNLARLDGISRPLKRPPTIEDYLQLNEISDNEEAGSCPKKKRVRWADVEEQKAQKKMRQMGFVVGVTDWSRMMDPSQGSSALTQTKYIARINKKT